MTQPVVFKSTIQGKNVDAYTFHCPGCGCSHWFKTNGEGPKWTWNGDFAKPTVKPSIKVSWTWGEERAKKCCHFFITDGRIQYCNDSAHELAGKTVDMVPDDFEGGE